jgi:hypothetical protein
MREMPKDLMRLIKELQKGMNEEFPELGWTARKSELGYYIDGLLKEGTSRRPRISVYLSEERKLLNIKVEDRDFYALGEGIERKFKEGMLWNIPKISLQTSYN